MEMATKVLGKMEATRGFIYLPKKIRSEIIGDISLPCSTTLNGNPARLDKRFRYGLLILRADS